jgi:replicative DNA helicase
MQKILASPMTWAEAIFPPKIVLEEYVDNNGVRKTHNRVAEGWMTRPWQQEVFEDPTRMKVIRVSRRAGKTLGCIVKTLHTAFVLGRGVLVFCPMERQVAEIYETMHAMFMDTRPDLFNDATIKTDTKSPYVIRFSNGGFINFITAGTKSGGKGDSARGQGRGVKLIYIDEADYMSDADLDAILAIQIQDPSMEVILTSTPKGTRNKFYQLCTGNVPGWKSFHKTCYETIPNFVESGMEESMRKQYSHDAFQHEFLAEFGEEATGVFKKDRIDDAILRGHEDFPYHDKFGKAVSTKPPSYGYAPYLPPDRRVHRIVGVDWDKYGAGTQILIIEALRSPIFNENAYAKAIEQPFDYIKVVHRREIPKSQFTLDNAVRELIAINHQFSPDFYYLDAGYGEHQIEALIRVGLECKDPSDPAYKLHEKIRRINFSQGIQAIDPATKMVEKRRIKPEMVNRLANKFDAGEMVLNPFDDHLKRQLENYVVVKMTASGEPKYTSEDEHAVDALMLATWGLYCEFGKKLVQSVNQSFVDGPIGDRYARVKQAMEQPEGLGRRPDYLAALDDVDLQNREEELRFAKSGMMRPDAIVSTKGAVPGSSQLASNDQSSYFHRGGRGWTPRRSF